MMGPTLQIIMMIFSVEFIISYFDSTTMQ